jgi:hypothetical protein
MSLCHLVFETREAGPKRCYRLIGHHETVRKWLAITFGTPQFPVVRETDVSLRFSL